MKKATNEKVVAAYYPNWAIYERNYHIYNCEKQGKCITHILYAFANLLPTGEVILGDEYADIDNHLPADKTVNGIADDWNETGNNIYGNYKQLYLLKQNHPHVKTLMSVGGWTWSGNFAAVTRDTEKRAIMIESLMNIFKNCGLDGIDIDWEYPKDNEEANLHVLLLKCIRDELDKYRENMGQLDQPPYLLTIAAPAGPANYQILNIGAFAPIVDYVFLMCYDYMGGWDTVAGHQANLYGGANNTDQAINYYIKYGLSQEKIILGMPIYGRGFSNTDGIGKPFNGVPQGTWEAGIYDYKDLPLSGATVIHDYDAVASYSYDSNKRELISYDTPEIIVAKCDYIKERELGGAMFWELSADHEDPNGSLNLVHTVYEEFDALDTSPNHMDYPESKYDNLRNHMGSKKLQNQYGNQSGGQSGFQTSHQTSHRTIYPTGNQSGHHGKSQSGNQRGNHSSHQRGNYSSHQRRHQRGHPKL